MKALSQQDLLGIVATASTIDERLDKGFLPSDAQANEVVLKTQLDTWCQTVAKGDWEQFRRRLAWDGLDEDMVRRVLGAVRVPKGLLLPAWADTLSTGYHKYFPSLTASAREDKLGVGGENLCEVPNPLIQLN